MHKICKCECIEKKNKTNICEKKYSRSCCGCADENLVKFSTVCDCLFCLFKTTSVISLKTQTCKAFSSVFLPFTVGVCFPGSAEEPGSSQKGVKNWDNQCDMKGHISSRHMILNKLHQISPHFKLSSLTLTCDTYSQHSPIFFHMRVFAGAKYLQWRFKRVFFLFSFFIIDVSDKVRARRNGVWITQKISGLKLNTSS